MSDGSGCTQSRTRLVSRQQSQTAHHAHNVEPTCTSMNSSHIAQTGDATKTTRLSQGFGSTGKRRIDSPMVTGTGSIGQMMALARGYNDGEPWPAENFILDAFTGVDDQKVVRRGYDYVTNHPLYNGRLTRHECIMYAREWDEWGTTGALDFVESLACDVIGSGKGDVVAETLQSLSFHDSQQSSEGNIDYSTGNDAAWLEPGLCTNEALDAAGW